MTTWTAEQTDQLEGRMKLLARILALFRNPRPRVRIAIDGARVSINV